MNSILKNHVLAAELYNRHKPPLPEAVWLNPVNSGFGAGIASSTYAAIIRNLEARARRK